MKRAGLAIVAVVVLAVAGLWIWRAASSSPADDGPIILISIDTLRADRLPAYGYTAIRTPNIDRLVADSVLFEQAYSHSPQTLPAHTSILSGVLPFEHGVRDNIGFEIRPDQRLLQHDLRERGYATGGFVSSYVLRRQIGINQGFDVYDDTLPAASPDKPLGQVQRAGADTVAAAIRWIDGQASPQFFLFTHIYEPHRPYAPPARFAGRHPYDGEVEYADEIIGGLLAHLRTKKLYDGATIILLSDHGEGLGDHGEDEHGIFLYRETIRVPLVIKLPGGAGAGRRVAAPVQHIDILPTILEIAGGPAVRSSGVRGPAQGRSLLPALAGTGALPPASIYSEALTPRYHFGWSELYALTEDRYRLIRAPRDELYDLTQDPAESTSIAAGRPQVHGAMRRALDAIIADAEVTAPSAVSEEDRRRLAALGYVGTQSGAPTERAGGTLPDPKDKIGVLKQYKHATDLAAARKFDEAIGAYRQLLRANPGMNDIWLQLADLHERRGQTAEAVRAYQEVIRQDPRNPAALTGIAADLLRLGRLDEARAHAELAVPVAAATAQQLLARIAIEAGDAAGARRAAKLAAVADPTLPMPAFVEGLLLFRQQQYAAAIPYFTEARRAMAARTVQLPDLNYYLADSLARLERYGEAESLFLAELAVFPANLRARAGLAMLYRATGRNDASDQAIAELVRTSPGPEGYGLAAQLWDMFGEPRRAVEARTQARRPPR